MGKRCYVERGVRMHTRAKKNQANSEYYVGVVSLFISHPRPCVVVRGMARNGPKGGDTSAPLSASALTLINVPKFHHFSNNLIELYCF